MTDEFAKLFGTGRDQVLVKLDGDEANQPEVRIYFKPPGLGVCSIALNGWKDNEADWKTADEAFAKVDEAAARSMIKSAMEAWNKA